MNKPFDGQVSCYYPAARGQLAPPRNGSSAWARGSRSATSTKPLSRRLQKIWASVRSASRRHRPLLVALFDFLDTVEGELVRFDVLVNNAGIMPVGRIVDEDDTVTRRIIEIDVLGAITGTKLAMPATDASTRTWTRHQHRFACRRTPVPRSVDVLRRQACGVGLHPFLSQGSSWHRSERLVRTADAHQHPTHFRDFGNEGFP